jgi:uncharacterized membrane protein
MTGKRSTLDWVFEAVAVAALALSIGLVAANWADLPETIPTHFGASGRANGWGGKGQLWVLAAFNVGTYALLTMASRYQRLIHLPFSVDRNDPEVQQLMRGMTIVLKAVLMLVFLYIARVMIDTAFGRSDGLGVQFLPVFLAATFLPVILFSRKLRKLQK